MKSSTMLVFLGLLLAPGVSPAAEMYTAFPAQIHANERYVIFLHGLIAEGEDPRPVHPEYGVYDLPAKGRIMGLSFSRGRSGSSR